MPRELSRTFLVVLFAMLVAANINVYRTLLASPALRVTVLNVGRSRAALVQSPGGRTVLVDTGPDAGVLRALGEALPPWQRRIDAVVLTAGVAGAAGGLPEVMSRYRVSHIARFGAQNAPYGARLTFNDASVEVIAPAVFTISYGATSLPVSSSTPAGVYTSDGRTVTKLK